MNKVIFVLAIIVALLLTVKASATTRSIAPQNNMYIPVSLEPMEIDVAVNPAKTKAGLTEKEFNTVLDRVALIYTPVIAKRGGKFNIVRSWTDGTVNAQAWKDGSVWNIEMFGGLARYKRMSMDAFALVACHETGHLIGGAPLYPGDDLAAEGQADFFGAEKCLKLYYGMDNSEEIIKNIAIDKDAAKACKAHNPNDLFVCKRISQASQILANLLADLGAEVHPHFGTPDPAQVTTTDVEHPAAQCRLDTYFHAALCSADPKAETSQTDYHVGYCTDQVWNSRARCWFAP